jgi:hypothetical protein
LPLHGGKAAKEWKADRSNLAAYGCCRFHSADPAQIAHRFSGAPIGMSELLRCASISN